MSAHPTLSGGERTASAEIRFHNTMSGQTEPFVPLEAGVVRSYTCGPTVYDFAHIGNFRTFVFQDVLRRYLKSKGFRVIQVMNLTDVDDRIIQKSAAAGLSIREYTDKYVQAYLDDRTALNLEPPEYIARATEHIDDMVKLIERLTKKGFTYTSEGSTYYRIAKFPAYGKLSKIDVAGMQTGARVDMDRYDKDNARDFALWKAPKPGEHFWETRIGPGRPGWHHQQEVRALLASRRASAGGSRKDVQVARKLRHTARAVFARAQAVFDPLPAGLRAIPATTEFHPGEFAGRGEFRGAAEKFCFAPARREISRRQFS
jgi:hypothetical protein